MKKLDRLCFGLLLVSVSFAGGCVAAECRDGSHAEGDRCVADDSVAGSGGTGGVGGTGGTGGTGGSGGSGGTGGSIGVGDDGGGPDSGTDSDGGVPPLACDVGYQDVAGSCADIDECVSDNGGCDALTTCTNTLGARTCGSCPVGYGGDGANGCVDIDECTTNAHDCDTNPVADCMNTDATFGCACPDGFSGDGHGGDGCMDINECLADNGGCDTQPMVSCTNNSGGHACGACPTGYIGNGVGEDGCVDVDECETNNGGCDPAAACTNTVGSFSCGACPSGYTGDGSQANGCVPQITSLKVNPGLPSATFNPTTGAYAITAGLMTRYVEVIASASVTGATITVGGQPVDSYGSRFQWIGSTSASVPVVVTDAFNRSRTYTLTVTRSGSVAQTAYVKPPIPVANGQLGRVVASDGETMAISSNSTGQAYGVVSLYARGSNAWVWQGDLSGAEFGPYNHFGRDGLAVEGDTLLVGQSDFLRNGYGNTGAVHVYGRVNGTWAKQTTLLASNGEADDFFGRSVAIDGDRIVVGAPGEDSSTIGGPSGNTLSGAGAAYVFARINGVWTEERYLKSFNADPADAFGTDVDVYRSSVVVGAPGEDGSGVGANPGSDNARTDSGAVYLFDRNSSGVWTQRLYMKNTPLTAAANARLGLSVALGTESQFAAGAPGAERAYVFHSPESGVWAQLAALSAADTDPDAFGSSVAMWGPGTVVVSAGGDDSAATQVNGAHDNMAQDSGAAYVFLRSSDTVGSGLGRDYYLKARNCEAGDGWIGGDSQTVAIAYDTIITGAPREDSMIGGLQSPGPTTAGDDDPSPVRESGAGYVFR